MCVIEITIVFKCFNCLNLHLSVMIIVRVIIYYGLI